MTNKYLPEQLEISYKHEINGTKSIKLLNNALLLNNPNPELIDINDISEERWNDFWEVLERIGLWDLEEEYQGCTLEGRFVWKIEIKYQNREINSYGSNIEPKTVIGDKIYSILVELYKSIDELIYFE